MKPSLILKGARALLARRGGWIQGSMSASTPDGIGYCAVGVISEVAGSPEQTDTDAYERTHKYVRAAAGIEGSMIGWNDKPGRRKSEVLRAFSMARAEAEARND